MYSATAFAVFALTYCVPGAFGAPQITPSVTQGPGVLATPLADLNAPAASASSSITCGGCYIVADVAALVWYSEAFINTAATQYVGVQVGNGTRSTRTSVVQNEAPFTYDPQSISSAGMQELVLTPVDYGPTAVIGGATLSSPTAYNVFSAYSITSAYISNGRCMTSSGPAVPVIPAYSETLLSTSGRVSLDPAGQQAFIDYLSFTTCSGGGGNAVASALIPVAHITVSVTTTFSGVPLAAITSRSLAPTTQPTSTARPADVVTLTEVMASTTVTATLTGTATPETSVSVPKIVFGSRTITPTPKPLSLAVLPGTLSGSLVTGSITGNTTITGYTQTVETVGTVVTGAGGETGVGGGTGGGGGTGVGGGTGGGGGNSTSIVPFLSEAGDWERGGWRVLIGMAVAGVLGIVMIL